MAVRRHHRLTFQWTCGEGNGREPWHARGQSTIMSSGVRQRRHGKKPLSPSCSETRLCPSVRGPGDLRQWPGPTEKSCHALPPLSTKSKQCLSRVPGDHTSPVSALQGLSLCQAPCTYPSGQRGTLQEEGSWGAKGSIAASGFSF